MSAKTADRQQSIPWLAWLLFGISIAGVVATLFLIDAGCGDKLLSGSPADRVANFVILASQFLFATLGLIILYNHPGHHIGWLSLVIGALGIVHPAEIYTGCNAIALPAGQIIPWFAYWGPPVLVVALFVLMPMLFPDGHFLSPRWRIFTVAGGTLYGLAMLLVTLLPGPMVWNGMGESMTDGPENPLALSFLPTSIGPFLNTALAIGFFILAMGAVLSLVLRFRRSQGQLRQQIKWLAYFLAVAFGTQMVFFELPGALFNPQVLDSLAYAFVLIVVFLGYPVVIGIAILRYRLFDIDVIIRRTLVYALVTGALALVYVGSIIVLQRLFVAISGQESTVAIVISTLLIARSSTRCAAAYRHSSTAVSIDASMTPSPSWPNLVRSLGMRSTSRRSHLNYWSPSTRRFSRRQPHFG